MTKVAMIQSNYIPWKGYFDIIHDVDLFVFYDDVQYTKEDWRNRNRIKTQDGVQWLTIPVGERIDRLICDVQFADPRWAKKHWRTIERAYGRAPHFRKYRDYFQGVYLDMPWERLSDLNQFLIKGIAKDLLGMSTAFGDSREYAGSGKKLDRALEVLAKMGADTFVSGPALKDYGDDQRFRDAGIRLIYKDYTGYPEYAQFHPPFEHHISILDLLFHCGDDAPYYIWGWREKNGI